MKPKFFSLMLGGGALLLAGVSTLFSGGIRNALADWSYILLNPYYALPGQQVTVSGQGFGNNEHVSITAAGQSASATTNGSGAFSSASFTVPFSAINSNVSVGAKGAGGTSTVATLVVGTFYPVVTPNNWYVTPGNGVSFTAKDFAPNEKVDITLNGQNLGTAQADASGNFSTGSYMVPYASGKIDAVFTGQSSKVSRTIQITVAGEPAYIVLSNYYAWQGANVRVNGFAFGANEQVTVRYEGQTVGTATAAPDGSFVLDFAVPASSAGKRTITATGNKTSKTATADFTKADESLPH